MQMINKNYKGNETIKRLVMCTDFIILNIVLLAYKEYGPEFTPDYFDSATKITFSLQMQHCS